MSLKPFQKLTFLSSTWSVAVDVGPNRQLFINGFLRLGSSIEVDHGALTKSTHPNQLDLGTICVFFLWADDVWSLINKTKGSFVFKGETSWRGRWKVIVKLGIIYTILWMVGGWCGLSALKCPNNSLGDGGDRIEYRYIFIYTCVCVCVLYLNEMDGGLDACRSLVVYPHDN